MERAPSCHGRQGLAPGRLSTPPACRPTWGGFGSLPRRGRPSIRRPGLGRLNYSAISSWFRSPPRNAARLVTTPTNRYSVGVQPSVAVDGDYELGLVQRIRRGRTGLIGIYLLNLTVERGVGRGVRRGGYPEYLGILRVAGLGIGRKRILKIVRVILRTADLPVPHTEPTLLRCTARTGAAWRGLQLLLIPHVGHCTAILVDRLVGDVSLGVRARAGVSYAGVAVLQRVAKRLVDHQLCWGSQNRDGGARCVGPGERRVALGDGSRGVGHPLNIAIQVQIAPPRLRVKIHRPRRVPVRVDGVARAGGAETVPGLGDHAAVGGRDLRVHVRHHPPHVPGHIKRYHHGLFTFVIASGYACDTDERPVLRL